MSRFSSFNVVAAVRDLLGFLRMRQRHEFAAALIAVAVTGWVLYAFDQDSYMERAPRIVYVESWPATRTDAQIEAEQKVDAAAKKKALDARTAEYRKLADSLGIKY